MRQKCTTEEFKKDISDLCEDCPIKIKILENLKNQIYDQAKERQDILPKLQFKEYLIKEIKGASEAMEKMYLLNMNQSKEFLPNRMEVYIWNKERIKVLKEFFVDINSQNIKNSNTTIDNIKKDLFNKITKLIDITGKTFERLPSTYSDKNEETLRDHIILTLQPNLIEFSVTSESFNKKGKTDLLIRKNGDNLFVGECKIWKGEKEFHLGINQLLSYCTWRDTNTALIVFVRNKNINKILNRSIELISSHSNHEKFINLEGEHILNFDFKIKSDSDELVRIKFMFYHIPTV